MEILIIGGVIVLIMVIISTQIKNSAARAFEREIVETADFRIVKPEGFMHPIRETSEYEFEAYSKEFGDNDERNFWRAQVYLSVSASSNFAAVCELAKQESEIILSEETFENAPVGEKICLIESEKIDDEIKFYEFRKIVESHQQRKIYNLRIAVLKSFQEAYSGRIEELADSFSLK